MDSQHSTPDRSAPSPATPTNQSAGRPSELRLLLPEEPTSLKTIFGSAGLTHIALVLFFVILAWLRPDRQIQAALPDVLPDDIVWLEQPGPGGGGGGGGNESPEPPKAEPVPMVKAPEPTPVPPPEPVPQPEPEPEPEPEPVPQLAAITPTTTAAVIAPTVTAPTSVGTGTGGGAGAGDGGGIGPGKGDGLGPGEGGNTGGGVARVGNGVLPPTLLHNPKPLYTSEAMLRRIQGEVDLDCVVLADGSVGTCEVVKSLDSNQFGLDNEALKAAKRFRFRPGPRQGEPVAVLVRIVLEFNMR
jgi:protein TonB